MRRHDRHIVSACTHRYLDFYNEYVDKLTDQGLKPWFWQYFKWFVEDVLLYWAQYFWLFALCESSAIVLHAEEVNMLVRGVE